VRPIFQSSGQRRHGLPAAQNATPYIITFGAFARETSTGAPQHCRLPEGKDHGRLRDTVAKACRRFHQRIEAVVEAGKKFLEKSVLYIPMNITCKFEQNILEINLLVTFLLKKCKIVGFSLRNLYLCPNKMIIR
jgi:hypothetical protein